MSERRILIISDGSRNNADVAQIADRIRVAAQDPDASWWASSPGDALDRAVESVQGAIDAFQAEADPNVGVFRALVASTQRLAIDHAPRPFDGQSVMRDGTLQFRARGGFVYPPPAPGPICNPCPKCGAQRGEECSQTFAHRFHKARF